MRPTKKSNRVHETSVSIILKWSKEDMGSGNLLRNTMILDHGSDIPLQLMLDGYKEEEVETSIELNTSSNTENDRVENENT